MADKNKPATTEQSDETLRKKAKKLIRNKNSLNIRPTHMFMHEKSLVEIVSGVKHGLKYFLLK